MNNLVSELKVELANVKSLSKQVKSSIFLIVFFGGLLIVMNYVKTHSAVFLASIIGVILGATVYGIFTIRNLSNDRARVLIFEFISLLIISGLLIGICLTSYYSYLGLTSNTLPIILFFSTVLLMIGAYFLVKKAMVRSVSNRKSTFITASVVLMGVAGYSLGMFLSRSLNQTDIHILLIVLTYLISVICAITSIINLVKHQVLRNNAGHKHKNPIHFGVSNGKRDVG